jgi:tripartite-type tricarboxylate transporter receptor subunit TctC
LPTRVRIFEHPQALCLHITLHISQEPRFRNDLRRPLLAMTIRNENALEVTMSVRLSQIVGACLLLACTFAQAFAQSDTYPDKPIRIITHSAAGGAPDVMLRIVGDRLGALLGQQIVVLNQPGAGGAVAARAAAGAVPDGYTLYMPAASAFVTLAGLQPNLPLEVPRDFIPIGFIGEQPMFFTVTPEIGVSSLQEFIALAKKQPGKLSYAATGRGTMTHLTGELLKSRADIDVLAVPYTGGAPQALNDALGGRLSMVIEGLSALSGTIQGGSMKAIAVGSPERLPDFPNLPAAAEILPGFNARGWAALVAPVGTPDAIVNKVSDALSKVVGETDVQKKLAVTGSYVRPMSPAKVMAFIQADQQMWKPILERIAANP